MPNDYDEDFVPQTPLQRKQMLRRKLLGLPKEQMHEVGVLIKQGYSFERAMRAVNAD